jgi:glycosyltransferase involved in cell wall biosynthesis
MRQLDQCTYRQVVATARQRQALVCRFLQQFTGVADEFECAVSVEACRSCCSFPEPSAGRLNPVVASLLYALTDRMIATAGREGGAPGPLAAAREAAESALGDDGRLVDDRVRFVTAREPTEADPRRGHCDVVVCCSRASEQAERAIQSVLDQRDVTVFLHLVDDGGGAAELLSRFGGRANVFPRHNPTPLGLFRTLHECVPALHTEFVAVQDPATTSRPGRLASAVTLLVEHGADVLAAALQTRAAAERPLHPGLEYHRTVPPETLVFRRAALVDMGGLADRPDDADLELIHRAVRERRLILLCDAVMVDCDGPRNRPHPPAPPVYSPQEGTLRHHALGFPAETVACDVVLPFRGQLEYVQEAIASLLEQEGAEVVVHLIDDASPGSESESWLRRWLGHPRVRTYRNLENIGPFSSFNNVAPYLETDLVAVQDGDDVSLPHRIQAAGNALRLAGAEVFGGRTRLFGAETSLRPSTTRAGEVMSRDRPAYRGSRIPTRRPMGHVIEHPTAMYRRDAFERLGGFADYGRTDRNCCGLDTEFYLRAAYGGARFAVSNQVVLRYRCHADSATQNAATGWGTAPRNWSIRECLRRIRIYQSTAFDPKAFGAIGRLAQITRRFPQECS